jgi:ribosomal protein S18 acetylase RimI-like enzyme
MNDLIILYLESFPREERRDINSLISMLEEKRMFFSAILEDGQLAGLVVYWDFEGFHYIEHLAVMPGHRGKGIAGTVLKKLQGKGNPILLEVEIPHNEASAKRVDFYIRAGFMALDIPYLQPPYREGESPLPMMLFSDHPDWDTETLNRCIELFQYQVYYSRLKG